MAATTMILPAAPPDTLETVETHTARVFLTADRAYKVRKPVRFPFVDYTDAGARRRAAEAEVALNRHLAPGVYLGVRPVGDGTDHAVVMRRFAERDTLAARLAHGRTDDAMLRAVGRRIAAFHRTAPPVGGGGAAQVLARVDRNAEELLELHRTWPGGRDVGPIVGALHAAVLSRAGELDARAARGLRRDGHGDLRADHVLIEADALRIIDRLEFDADLRCDDVGCDVAFLLMDLEARGARAAARTVLGAYRAAGGDPGDDGLVACWSAYRATVAAKVAHLRAAQGVPGADAVAHERLALAHRLLWRAHGPRVLAVCGPPATGKSTLAAALAEATGAVVLASDVVRKERLGLAPDERAPDEAYTMNATAAVYGALGHRARVLAHYDGLVVVDATMHRRGERAAFVAGLGRSTPVTWVACHAPAAVVRRNAERRMGDRGRVSDATPEIARAIAAAWEPVDEAPAGDVLTVRTDRPVSAVVTAVEAGLR
jgi:aminoglycoside phosphotransferase family enzyme/predicted kinase